MGGEVLLYMEKGETRKVHTFLKTICEKGEEDSSVLGLEGPDPGMGYSAGGCWIECKGRVIQVGYQFHELSDAWALAVACAIRDRFKVIYGGWDSVGYCSDFMTTRPWRVQISMTKQTLKRYPNGGGLYTESWAEDIELYRKWQRLYEETVDKLFSSIPKHEGPRPWQKKPKENK